MGVSSPEKPVDALKVRSQMSQEEHVARLPGEIEAAAQRIRPYVRATPLLPCGSLSERARARVYCKLENLQVTGSFKVRGAFNKILSLPREVRERGVVAASTGNHGAAVAYALGKLGASGVVFVPAGTSQAKIAAIRGLGAEVRVHGDESGETERFARSYASQRDLTYVSPYNDWEVVAGQGTIGLEIAAELGQTDVVIASAGGGGLIGGIAASMKSRDPKIRIVAASPRNSMTMIESARAGKILKTRHLPTLSDSTAGGVEEDAITFELFRSLVDQCVAVGEDEIAAALRSFIDAEHMLLEGAAAVACAALAHLNVKALTVVVVICGANISAERLKAAL
jgi:threonine dehydratase